MVKNNLILILIISVFFTFLTSCDNIKVQQNNNQVTSEKEKEELLKKRVLEFWQAKVANDKEKLYDFYDPFFKFRVSKDAFKVMGANIFYENPRITTMQIEGNVAKTKVALIYYGELMGRLQPVKIEKTPAEVEQTWLFIDGNWYLQYIDNITESSFIIY